MKKLLLIAIILAFAASGAFAAKATFTFPILPEACDSGGPDDYGYRWEDSDNGGDPVFNWVDITGIGTLVEGLMDDNTVGTFDVGFDFPFYWYYVNSFWVGSNGYISFGSGVSYSQDFDPIPNRNQPNDIICPLAADLDFTSPYGTNECYYYTNNVDSLVVSWIGVAEWNNPYQNTRHTFQLILCAADSSITFQYGEQVGNFQNPDGANQIGIEDLVGGTGLQYLNASSPPDHMPHDELVIRIHPDPDPDFVFEDVGIIGVMNPTSGGVFQRINTAMMLGTYVRNAGTVAMDDVPVNCKVKRSYWTEYNETVNIAHLDPGEVYYLEFPLLFTPDQDEVYSIITKTMLQDDFFFNNSDTCEMRLVESGLVNELTYVDTVVQYTSWQGGGGGFANEFVAPGTINLTMMRANLSSDGTPSYWYILDADEQGNPDQILFGDTLNANGDNWFTTNITGDITFNYGERFFAAILSGGEGVTFGMDTSWPLCNRGWENTGSYAPSRDRDEQDICISVFGDVATAIDDNDARPVSFVLNQNYPNPFNATTEIIFNTAANGNVSLDVYNIAGQKIRNLANGHLGAGSHNVVWDGTNDAGNVVSSGVYFYKLSTGDRTETRKMVLIK